MALDADLPAPIQEPRFAPTRTAPTRVSTPSMRAAPPIPRRTASQFPQLLDQLLATVDNVHRLCYLLGPSYLRL